MKTSATTTERLFITSNSSESNLQPDIKIPADTKTSPLGATPTSTTTSSWPLRNLSHRECQVLQLIGEGNSIRKTGAVLELSPKTVETYCDRIKRKLGLRSGAELRHLAILSRVLDRTLLNKKLSQRDAPHKSDFQGAAIAVFHSIIGIFHASAEMIPSW